MERGKTDFDRLRDELGEWLNFCMCALDPDLRQWEGSPDDEKDFYASAVEMFLAKGHKVKQMIDILERE